MEAILIFCLMVVALAVMETLQHHFSTSIFNHPKLDPQFWNPAMSWENKYNYWPRWLWLYVLTPWTDAYHQVKLVFLVLGLLFAITYTPVWHGLVYVVLYIIVFNGCYHYLLKKETWE